MLLKKLSLATAATLLLSSACVVNDSGDDGGETGNASNTSPSTSSSSTTASTSTTTTTTDPTSTTEEPTTGDTEATTTATTTATGTDTDISGTDTDATGSGTDTDAAGGCGWGPLRGQDVDDGYQCGIDGVEDPDGVFPIACGKTADLTVGADCTAAMVTAEGCCDADGNVWYCVDPDGAGPMPTEVGTEDCGA